jgi:hypothetical protein
MTTIDSNELVTATGGVTMGPNGEGCIRLPSPFPKPQQPGLPGPRDPGDLLGPRLPLGKQAGGTRW